jgi:hypothetical protein
MDELNLLPARESIDLFDGPLDGPPPL